MDYRSIALFAVSLALLAIWSVKAIRASDLQHRHTAWLQRLDHLNDAEKQRCTEEETAIKAGRRHASLSGIFGFLAFIAAFML